MVQSNLTVTIDEGLRALDSLLVISMQDRSQVTSRQAELEKIMVEEFDALTTTMPGAYARNTLIQPLEDNIIDLFVQLPPELGQRSRPLGLMSRLEDLLVQRYPEAAITEDGKAVLVCYPDVSFRVVPCFYRENKGYVIADIKKSKWIKTNPSNFYYALDDANFRHSGLLLPVIRIIKHWNRRNGKWFNDYYLELLITEALSDTKATSYVQAIKHVFRKAIRLVVFSINDPADYGSQKEGLRDVYKMVEAMLSFQACHGHIVRAEQLEEQGDLISAYREWRKIFADDFPSYVDIMADKLEANGVTGAEALKILRDAT
ncbi:MAG: hypothetical protein OEZ15_09780 [Gammaproteobacteria bacterium]|nr:hypothetical protein [Gammaproteobacteria bacterium]